MSRLPAFIVDIISLLDALDDGQAVFVCFVGF
jgi:hypothetical protein